MDLGMYEVTDLSRKLPLLTDILTVTDGHHVNNASD